MDNVRECIRLKGCPFFNDQLSDMPAVADLLKKQYCKGNFENCARYIVAKEIGKENVPKDLWPNQDDRLKDILKKER